MNKYIHTTLKGTLTAIMLMVGISAWADNVAKIGTTEYATLQEAITAATDGQTVTLIADINETETYTIDKTITIDFGAFTISASHTTSSASSNADIVFDIQAGGNLTVTGSTGGVTDATVLGIFNNAGTLTINGGHYTTTTDDYGVVYNNGGTCTIAGGELHGAWAAVYNRTGSVSVNGGTLYGAARGINAKTGTTVNITNGSISSGEIGVFGEASSHISMSDGSITATATSVYLDGAGAEATISGGTINAAWGVQLYAGTSLSFTGGSITATANGVDIKGTGTTATISGGTIKAANGVLITDQATLTVNAGASITGTNTAISGNGNEGKGGTTITINGGTMTTGDNAKGVGIYHPQIGGQLTINGGEIIGNTAVEVRSGTLSITGGTLTANAASYSCESNGSGSTTVGAALAIAQHTTQKNINVNIEGGRFTGIKAINEANPEGNPTPQIDLSVTAGNFTGEISTVDVENFIEGGTYSEAFPATYCVEGKAPYVDENGACTIITPETEVPTDAEALSNGSYYKVLNSAITAAGAIETTIDVLKDPTADAITISAGAIITLAVANEVTLSKPITNNGTLSMNGTVSGAINNSGTLTITSGTISGAITIADAEASVKIATGVAFTSTVALSPALEADNVLKSSTTKVSGYTSFWAEKKVTATVDLTGEPTSEQTTAAEALVANTSISTVTGLVENQSLTITVTSVELTASKVMKATFEVKLWDADGREKTGTVPAVTFHLPIHSTIAGTSWVNLWHNTTAIRGMEVQGTTPNGYVTVTTTTFSPFSYEIIETPIAQIEETKYASVADAITAAPTSPAEATEITLVGTATDVTEAITVGTNKNVKLTIGEHTVSGNVTNNGTLAIADGTISGTITNTGTLSISDGTISNSVTATAGTLTISGGTFSETIETSSTAGLTISDGTMNGALSVGGSGTNTISGGTISGAVTTSAATTISGGEITNDITNSAALTITGGTFTGTITNTGTVAISGGTHTTLPVSGFCTTGYMPIKNAAGKYEMTNHWTITDETVIDDSHFEYLTSDARYSVATATYHRNTGMVSAGDSDTKFGTICLPFVIAAKPSDMTLYMATSIVGNTLTITAVDHYPVAAGTPLIFELSAKASNMTVTSTDGGAILVNTTAPTTIPAGDNLLVGSYTAQNITTGLPGNIYYLNGDKFHQAVSSLAVPAFRAYMDVTPVGSVKEFTLTISKDDNEATGIQQTAALEGVTEVYDMNGRKLSGLQRGVNIMRRADGSTIKVVVK